MVDPVTLRRWLYRLMFVGLVALILFVRMLPLDTGSQRWPGPDLIVLLAFAWVLRRPDYVPTLLVALVVLLTDMLLQRPPGIYAALVVMGLEFLRSREQVARDLPFMVEWALVAAVLTLVMLGFRLTLFIFMVDQNPLGQTMVQHMANLFAYPLIVVLTQFAFGVTRIAPGDLDELKASRS